MTYLIVLVVGDIVGFVSAWFIAHRKGYRKGYAAGQGTVRRIPAQRRGDQ